LHVRYCSLHMRRLRGPAGGAQGSVVLPSWR
jgi:hypothetical protein